MSTITEKIFAGSERPTDFVVVSSPTGLPKTAKLPSCRLRMRTMIGFRNTGPRSHRAGHRMNKNCATNVLNFTPSKVYKICGESTENYEGSIYTVQKKIIVSYSRFSFWFVNAKLIDGWCFTTIQGR